MATRYERGRAREYRSKRLLEAMGYEVTRAAGSHGPWDLVGISDTDIVLVQVKLGTKPSGVELESLTFAKCPPNGRKLVHVWQERAHLPQVMEV